MMLLRLLLALVTLFIICVAAVPFLIVGFLVAFIEGSFLAGRHLYAIVADWVTSRPLTSPFDKESKPEDENAG